MSTASTIVALASGAGRAGVAVMRVSGSKAKAALAQLSDAAVPAPRKAVLRTLKDPRDGTLIDRAVVLFFEAPASFTGEDVVEFHVHGGAAVIDGLLDALCSLDGMEPAAPGAFTRRAFENGKMDLTEAEGLADLVDAQTAAQRKQALWQMDGALKALYENWAERLTDSLARVEAEIDFADEEDVPKEITHLRTHALDMLGAEINAHLNDGGRGEKVRQGFSLALLGAPNAGKSSLLNALARREAAIVSSIPGTTRDVVEVQLDLGGWLVTIADTAGLRESADVLETEGVRRALARAETADLKLLLFDGTCAPDEKTLELWDENALGILTKSDVMTEKDRQSHVRPERLLLSAKTGEGVAALEARLIQEIKQRFAPSEAPALTRARHRQALEECRAHLRRASAAVRIECQAEDLRLALRALGRITGRVDVEDLLDRIFSTFCVGK